MQCMIIFLVKIVPKMETLHCSQTKKRGEWPRGLRRCECIGRFLVQTPLDVGPGLQNKPIYKGPSDLWVKSDKNAVSEAFPSIIGQSWL